VSLEWQTKLARLSRMDREEIRTRATQEFHKRADLVLYRMGVQPKAVWAGGTPSRQPEFFFMAGAARERAELLRAQLPARAMEILHEAENICRHQFHILGYESLDYGPEIDWHLDRVHGKRAPLDPWFKIPFLDFAAVGDHKITWELNRHQHLVTLAKAWLLSSDERYIREIVAQWRSWIKSNPYPLGINWGSSLEVAFRSLSWIWVDQLLAGAPAHAEFREELLPALAFHGRYIARYLSTYFSPNTHLIGEAAALFFIGTLYPEMAMGSRWQKTGWDTLLKEAQRQVRPDGVYFEQSLYYHVYALDFFLHSRLLAAKNGVDVPGEFDATLGRMLDVIQALSSGGPPEGFGDDDGGRVFDPRRNKTDYMTDPLVIGTALYARDDLTSARVTEESIWLLGNEAVRTGVAERTAVPRSASFLDAGIYILADPAASLPQVMVDAGPQGIHRCGHGHADALSLRLTMNGQRWLVDSGARVYISADATERDGFRGTGAHNTMRVDGLDQAQGEGPFAWSAIPTTRLEGWTVGTTFSYFAGSHDGYTRLADSVTHRRHIVKINGGPTLVRDLALGQEEHDVEVLWHFAPELEVFKTGEQGKVTSRSQDGSALSMIIPNGTPWRIEVGSGLISPAYGKVQPAPLVRVHARLRLPAEVATLLAPVSNSMAGDSQLTCTRQSAAQVYEWVEASANHGFLFALGKHPWSFGPWFSDAEFLYYCTNADRLAHLVVIGGTYVGWKGQELLKAPAPSSFEWRKQDGVPRADPDQFSISSLFQELTSAFVPGEPANISSSYAEKP
jgi:hypothetical protein